MKDLSHPQMFYVLLLILLFTLSCAGPQKSVIQETANPLAEIQRIEMELQTAKSLNIDVLGPREFKRSVLAQARARRALADGESQRYVLRRLSEADTHLNKAYEAGKNRQLQAPGLFEARRMAILAKANSLVGLQDEFTKIDEKISGQAARLNRLKPSVIANYQAQYIALESKAVVMQNLGGAQAIVNGAKAKNASEKAPDSLRRAEQSLATSESAIISSLRDQSGYQETVDKAKKDAEMLERVMIKIEENDSLNERTARSLIDKDDKIEGLNKLNARYDQESKVILLENEALSRSDQKQREALRSSEISRKRQIALESARSEFSPLEAEAFQQGDHLVIRLKRMAFASGSADLPSISLPLLNKVLRVAKTLSPVGITVEGHTDSLGSAKINQSLSIARANAVVKYFRSNGFSQFPVKAEGYGFDQPLVTNKTILGRAENRRVDIIFDLAETDSEVL